uniref:Uncharacterized protein n=1 Tax=Timema poppense TaxID=170557 RepID=A0A7R9H9D2_TIMPO|nr:unnamed protein product [Timema poppensis]
MEVTHSEGKLVQPNFTELNDLISEKLALCAPGGLINIQHITSGVCHFRRGVMSLHVDIQQRNVALLRWHHRRPCTVIEPSSRGSSGSPDWYLVIPTIRPTWPHDKQPDLPAYDLS